MTGAQARAPLLPLTKILMRWTALGLDAKESENGGKGSTVDWSGSKGGFMPESQHTNILSTPKTGMTQLPSHLASNGGRTLLQPILPAALCPLERLVPLRGG